MKNCPFPNNADNRLQLTKKILLKVTNNEISGKRDRGLGRGGETRDWVCQLSTITGRP